MHLIIINNTAQISVTIISYFNSIWFSSVQYQNKLRDVMI